MSQKVKAAPIFRGDIMKSILILVALFSFSASAEVVWKSIFISGDHSIPNFDNGRKVISQVLAPLGAYEDNQTHLSSRMSELNSEVSLADAKNIEHAFANLKVDPKTEGCLVFMTSHGTKNQGFYLSRAGILSPKKFAEMLNKACGQAPTVVLVSACYSGQFITPETMGKNRIILTAAIQDRPSFGCSTDTEYTFWDECVIDSIPASKTWRDLYENVKVCIDQKETRLGARPSLPQGFFGDAVVGLSILNK